MFGLTGAPPSAATSSDVAAYGCRRGQTTRQNGWRASGPEAVICLRLFPEISRKAPSSVNSYCGFFNFNVPMLLF